MEALSKYIAEPIVNIALYTIAGVTCRNQASGWQVIGLPPEQQQIVIRTGVGERNPKFVAGGVARIFDVYERPDGGLNVTFSHGRWLSRLLDRMIEFDHSQPDAPILSVTSGWLLRSFQNHSFTARLLPWMRDGALFWPALKRGDLVEYKLLLTNDTGNEGVALELAPCLNS